MKIVQESAEEGGGRVSGTTTTQAIEDEVATKLQAGYRFGGQGFKIPTCKIQVGLIVVESLTQQAVRMMMTLMLQVVKLMKRLLIVEKNFNIYTIGVRGMRAREEIRVDEENKMKNKDKKEEETGKEEEEEEEGDEEEVGDEEEKE